MRAQRPLFGTPWTVARQAALSTGFPREEHRGGLPFLSPGDLPVSGASTRDPTHDRVMRRRPDKQGRSGLQEFQKAALALTLKMICLSDACYIRLLPNFWDTGRWPSPISLQTEST